MLKLVWTFLKEWPLLLICASDCIVTHEWVHVCIEPSLYHILSLLLTQELYFLQSLLLLQIKCSCFLRKIKKVTCLLLYIFEYLLVELFESPSFLLIFFTFGKLEVTSSCCSRIKGF